MAEVGGSNPPGSTILKIKKSPANDSRAFLYLAFGGALLLISLGQAPLVTVGVAVCYALPGVTGNSLLSLNHVFASHWNHRSRRAGGWFFL